jgi:hypothetical protein
MELYFVFGVILFKRPITIKGHQQSQRGGTEQRVSKLASTSNKPQTKAMAM